MTEPARDGAELALRDDGQEPWQKLPNEGLRAYFAFCTYRDLGPQRSLVKAGRALSKTPATLAEWSSKYQWVARVEAYDLEMERRGREARESAVIAAKRRHAAAGARLQMLALERIRGNEEKKVAALDPSELTAADTIRALDVGVRIEMMALGLAAAVFGGAGGFSMAEFQNCFRAWMEIALAFVPVERQAAFVAAVEGLGSR